MALKCNEILIMSQEDDFHLDSMECPENVSMLLMCNSCTESFLLKDATLNNELGIRIIKTLSRMRMDFAI